MKRKNFATLEIPQEKWETLIQKLEQGERWDCYKEEYTDFALVSEYTLEDGTVETRYDYPDGSVRISGFKPGIDESQIAPLAVEGGKWQTVSGASYCIGALVYEKTAFVHLEFMILTAQQV